MQIVPASSSNPTYPIRPIAPVQRQTPEAAERERVAAAKAPSTGLLLDIKA